MVLYILGHILKFESAFLTLPALVGLLYREKEGIPFLLVAVLCLVLGLFLTRKRPASSTLYTREGFVTVALSWIIMSIFGAIPFVLSGDIPSYVDALFETISGFTTTGASILTEVESLSRASLFWRSFTHWIGGMGVLVFLLAVVPMSGGSNMNLMRAESPGPSVGKLVPKVRYTARILYLIYLGMTVVEILLLIAGRMPLFDAVTTSFGTAGTGGFGIKNDSIAGYSAYSQWVITIFMILFGVNFNAYYLILFGRIKKALCMEEVRYYFLIIFASVGLIFASLVQTTGHIFSSLRHASFQVASIITTTGFSTVDFDTWSQTSRTVLVLLMFIGACAGSTGGGIKVSRFVILFKTVTKEIHSYIHPKSIRKIKFEGKPVEHEVVRATNVYFITFVILFSLSMLIVSFEGRDMLTNFTAVAATINNIGPGLELVGPTQNFGFFTPLTKWVLMFDMLAGRLELFPLLLLFHPAAWRDMLPRRKKRDEE